MLNQRENTTARDPAANRVLIGDGRLVALLAALACVLTAATRTYAAYPPYESVGGQPHTNMMAYAAVNFISRNADPTDITLLASDTIPAGWSIFDGPAMGLPDLRGRAVLHSGHGPGLTDRPFGTIGGVDSVTLTVEQMGVHSHNQGWYYGPFARDPNDSEEAELPPAGGGQPHPNMQPYLALNTMIALAGASPRTGTVSGRQPFVGEVRLVPDTAAPSDWALTNGQLLDLHQNMDLFEIVGTIYGGDGRSTFGLPDPKGRAIGGQGSPPGGSYRSVGSKGGVETVAMRYYHVTPHDHWNNDADHMANYVPYYRSHPNDQPTLTMSYIIAIEGEVPSPTGPASDGPFLGEIRMFAGNFAPDGWALAQGQILDISQFSQLYSVLGTAYGGTSTVFALPDLRGGVAIQAGTGPGLTHRPLGVGGTNRITLIPEQVPAHDHIPDPATVMLIAAGAVWMLRRKPR